MKRQSRFLADLTWISRNEKEKKVNLCQIVMIWTTHFAL